VPELESDIPPGIRPPNTDHVYGGTPPAADRLVPDGYGTETVPLGSNAADTVRGFAEEPATTSVNVADVVNPPEDT
jgi:hypothetical protein